MTTIAEERVACAVCGCESEVAIIASTNEMGYPDLDLRPPEMRRSTIWMWVQECPACGYCAQDIAEAEPGAQLIVETAAFTDFRNGLAELARPARPFRTAAFIAAERLQHEEAFHHTLHEAWVHDDLGDPVRASAARLNAVDFLNLVHLDGGTVLLSKGEDAVLAADLLRRAGAFERAAELCTQALADPANAGLRAVLELQLRLCGERDKERHTVGEVGK